MASAPHVLIADDDPTFRLLMQAAFRKDGWQVSLASDAMQAVMMAGRQPAPDIILLDLNMPAGNGAQALERLRLSSRTQGIPVVVVSGAVEQFGLRQRADELKVWAIVEKPADPDAMVELAREATGLRR